MCIQMYSFNRHTASLIMQRFIFKQFCTYFFIEVYAGANQKKLQGKTPIF